MQKLSELSQKNVINIDDGGSIGKITDIVLDETTGRINSLIIAGKMRAFGLLGRQAEVVIPWDMISRVGNDVILVRLGAIQGKKTII